MKLKGEGCFCSKIKWYINTCLSLAHLGLFTVERLQNAPSWCIAVIAQAFLTCCVLLLNTQMSMYFVTFVLHSLPFALCLEPYLSVFPRNHATFLSRFIGLKWHNHNLITSVMSGYKLLIVESENSKDCKTITRKRVSTEEKKLKKHWKKFWKKRCIFI